ncbi:MAG TPA: M56 family metallopeptidase [Gammaproteobacteria bacterium]|nr:M56 family metallopeptidase [Gammaproteobacteria bacterium]
MSVLLDMLIPAVALSAVAAAGLSLLPKAPVRVRLALAIAGLIAWLVPWPWIRVPVALPASLETSLASLEAVMSPFDSAAAPAPVAGPGLVWWLAAALAIGAAWFVVDCVGLRASIESWRARSRNGEHLRELLPPLLRPTRAAIRIVAGSRVAAAAGWFRPTIWIGDGFDRADARVVLVHECWHVRRGDPLVIAAIVLVKRVYWWNPIVAHLASRALLLVEAACDRRCGDSLGTSHYIERLASMMLDRGVRASPRLAAAARGRENLLRLELLSRPSRWRARDRALLVALCAFGVCIMGWRVSEALPSPLIAQPSWSRVAIPDTPAGKALVALLDLDAWSSGVELVDIVRSEPLRIEYIVENGVDETRRLGRLEVADGPGLRVTSSAIRDLGAGER